MAKQDRDTPRSDGKSGGQPTPQGPKAAGPGNAHGVPPEDSPGDSGLDERPFHPEGGRPAADPEAMAQRVLKQAETGPKSKGDAGPLGVGDKDKA